MYFIIQFFGVSNWLVTYWNGRGIVCHNLDCARGSASFQYSVGAHQRKKTVFFSFAHFREKGKRNFIVQPENGGSGMHRTNSVLQLQGSFTRSAFAHFSLSSRRAKGGDRVRARSHQQHNVVRMLYVSRAYMFPNHGLFWKRRISIDKITNILLQYLGHECKYNCSLIQCCQFTTHAAIVPPGKML